MTKVKLILSLGFYPSPQLKLISASGELKRTTKQTVVHKHIHYVVWCVVTVGKVLIKTSYKKTQQKIESSVTPLWTTQSSDANSILKVSEFCNFIQEHYCVFYIWSIFMLNRVAQKSKVPTGKIFSTKCQWLLHARKIVKLLICLKNN